MARQPRPGRGTPAAAHSYLHVVRKNGIHPYIKRLGLAADRKAAAAPWKVTDLLKAYDWPSDAPGRGVIAIVELGGGWVQSDVDQFFKGVDLPAPHITDVSVDGTENSKCNPRNDADGEVALDIQVAGAAYAAATGKPAAIRVYWAQDIAQAITAAAADGCDVCSISWGADEASWGAAAGDALEQAATAATSAGMVIFAASGDNDLATAAQAAPTSICRPPRRTLSAAAARRRPRLTKRSGTIILVRPTGKAPAAATRRFFRCRRGRPAHLTALAAWFQTSPRTPIRSRAMKFCFTASKKSSAAPAPSPLSTPACSRRSERNSASSRRSCI